MINHKKVKIKEAKKDKHNHKNNILIKAIHLKKVIEMRQKSLNNKLGQVWILCKDSSSFNKKFIRN